MVLRVPQERCKGQGALGIKVEGREVKTELQGGGPMTWETRFPTNQNLGSSTVANQNTELSSLFIRRENPLAFPSEKRRPRDFLSPGSSFLTNQNRR